MDGSCTTDLIETMKENEVRIALIGLTVVFIAILAAFRKNVTYPFCTLEKYTGKVNRGKSSYLLMFHFFISLGLGIACYVSLNKVRTFSTLFEDTFIRLITILLL